MNSRLFPVPLHWECCPVCKKHKSSHPHTLANPALVRYMWCALDYNHYTLWKSLLYVISLIHFYLKRVSIPCSAVLPPYKHRPHRRCSFNPSDSLGLPSVSLPNLFITMLLYIPSKTHFIPFALVLFVFVQHCLAGWSNKGQNSLPVPGNLDLRSSTTVTEVSHRSRKPIHVCLPDEVFW